jgi:tetratricopeptide (TPR) repeat protein
MMRTATFRLVPLVLLLLWSAASRAGTAQDPGPMLVRGPGALALLEEGRSEMIAFRLDAAEATFERLAADPSGRPAALLHLTKIALWRGMIMEQDALYDRFFAQSDRLFEVLDAMPDSPWRTHFRAEAELYRAVIHAKKTEYARAAFALRQAYKHFERNVEEHPQFFESTWGMGLCHTAVGLVPKQFRWVLRLMGFEGTVQQGLDEIEASAERSVFYREEASIVFALTDLIVNEAKEGGMDYIVALRERHADSPLVGYIHGFALLHERRAAEAEAALRRTDRLLRGPGTYPMPYVDYFLGDALFRQNEFAEAARHFERYVNTFPGEALLAQAHLHLGLAREMAGDRAGAIRAYEQVRTREDYDSDHEALREAQDRLETPLAGHERTLLLGRNAFDGGRYREAVRLLQPVLGDQEAPPIMRAEAAYRSGRAFHVLEEWRDALRHYRFAVSRPGDELAKWGPWSQYYIGEVHEARGDEAAAQTAYERALAYDVPFAYHKALEQRAKAALGRL